MSNRIAATCRPWVATRKALGQIPGGWAVIDPVTEWSMPYKTPLWPLLGLTGGRIGPIRSIGWSCQALAPICFISTVLLNLHLQQVPNTYLLGARKRWLRVNCVENRKLISFRSTWKKLHSFLEARRIVGSYMGEAVTPPLHGGRIEPMTTTNTEHSWRNWSSWKPMIGQSFRSTWKKLHSVEFYQAPAQQQVANGERFNFVVQTKNT